MKPEQMKAGLRVYVAELRWTEKAVRINAKLLKGRRMNIQGNLVIQTHKNSANVWNVLLDNGTTAAYCANELHLVDNDNNAIDFSPEAINETEDTSERNMA